MEAAKTRTVFFISLPFANTAPSYARSDVWLTYAGSMPDCLEYFNFEFWWMSGSKLRIADTCFCQEYIADRYWPSRDRTGGGVKRSRLGAGGRVSKRSFDEKGYRRLNPMVTRAAMVVRILVAL
ncbi:MAG: hypothetical protein ACJAR9_000784 [Celeribacter sp.]|jgi:hypothetical protein